MGVRRLKTTRKSVAASSAMLLCFAVFGGCEAAPVTGWDDARSWEQTRATYYTVVAHRGDTLPAIADRYNVSVEKLSRMNDVPPDVALYPGDVLRVPANRATRYAVMRDATDDRASYAPPTSKDLELAEAYPALAPRPVSEQDRIVVRREPDITPHASWHREARLAALPRQAPHIVPRPRPHVFSAPPVIVAARVVKPEHEIIPQREHAPVRAVEAAPVVEGGERLSASSDGTFAAPCGGRIIQGFGTTGSGQRNDGVNIAAAAGTPIHAAADGVVTYAGNELKGYGNLILIKHDGDYVTAYAHANAIGVARGQHVGKGDVIGTVGQTGDVDQPQLHFEIRQGMKPVDPRPLVMASAN